MTTFHFNYWIIPQSRSIGIIFLCFVSFYLFIFQEAVARGFEFEMSRMDSTECYFYSLAEELLPKREFMAKFLSDVGMVPTIPEGGYFMIADWTPLGMS